MAILIVSAATFADGEGEVSTVSAGSEERCGVYCLYAALRFYGRPVPMEALITPQYIEPRKGSSLAQLKEAAVKFGLFALPVKDMKIRDLRRLNGLAILHLKADVDSEDFDHFELYLGTEERMAKIYNVPDPPRQETFKHLSSRWDGSGLIVSPNSVQAGTVGSATGGAVGLIIGFAAIIMGGAWLVTRRVPLIVFSDSRRFLRAGFQFLGITTVACMAGLAFNALDGGGILALPSDTEEFRSERTQVRVDDIDSEQFSLLLQSKSAVLVDARYPTAHRAGHIHGAVNIPPDLGFEQRHMAMAGVGKDFEIVVYCQSELCPYAEKVARRLLGDGFTHVRIFKKGWRGWQLSLPSTRVSAAGRNDADH